MLTIILKKIIEGGQVGKVQNRRCSFGKLIPLQIQSYQLQAAEKVTRNFWPFIEGTDLTGQQKAWTL